MKENGNSHLKKSERVEHFENYLSVGCDIELIDRFRQMGLKKISELNVFSKNELLECKKKKDPFESLAARFAGKEAVYKALSSLFLSTKSSFNLKLSAIEITTKNNIPFVKVHDLDIKKLNVCLSLSHTKENALAFAIVHRLE